jgi:hypothetical protein
MRYSITLDNGGWVVFDTINQQIMTEPATSEEAQEAVKDWNGRCVSRPVDPPVPVYGWGPAGKLTLWLLAEDGWWGLVTNQQHATRWFKAEDLRRVGH